MHPVISRGPVRLRARERRARSGATRDSLSTGRADDPPRARNAPRSAGATGDPADASRHVLAIEYAWRGTSLVCLHNLAGHPVEVSGYGRAEPRIVSSTSSTRKTVTPTPTAPICSRSSPTVTAGIGRRPHLARAGGRVRRVPSNRRAGSPATHVASKPSRSGGEASHERPEPPESSRCPPRCGHSVAGSRVREHLQSRRGLSGRILRLRFCDRVCTSRTVALASGGDDLLELRP